MMRVRRFAVEQVSGSLSHPPPRIAAACLSTLGEKVGMLVEQCDLILEKSGNRSRRAAARRAARWSSRLKMMAAGARCFSDDGNEQSFLWAELTQSGKWLIDTSPKQKRNADKLKELILQKIERHPVCPAGMSVEVRHTSGEDWEALAVPPPGQHIAYADCADYITKNCT